MTAYLDCSQKPLHNVSTLADILSQRAQNQPKQTVFRLLQNTEASNLTYQELDQQARAIAASLKSLLFTGE